MKIDLIEQFKKALHEKWVKVKYSEQDIWLNAELLFYEKKKYEVVAREIWLFWVQKHPTERIFMKKVSKYLRLECEQFDISQGSARRKSKRVVPVLWKLTTTADAESRNEKYVNDIEIELRQKYRTHCCTDLNQTDNAGRRYFYRSRVVYVREINAYVLTNLRNYLYDEVKDEYVLDQSIRYELLDYCPFCGFNLKELRLPSPNEHELVENAIRQYRDCAPRLLDEGESYEDRITYYGINFYDSIYDITNILSDKYVHYNNEFGVDEQGKISPRGTFITVEKMFDLCEKYSLYYYFDYENLKDISSENAVKYFREKFRKKMSFTDDERYILRNALVDFLVDIFQNPSDFDELKENAL